MGVYALGILSMLLLSSEGISAWDIAWRMTICGIGYGMFQTPNSIIMVTATPVQRTGSAGGMQSTARLVGQTFGAALVTIVFSAVGGTPYHLVHVCLWLAIAFALIAGGFSIFRKVKG